MTVSPGFPARLLGEQLDRASPDLLRGLLTVFLDMVVSAQADATGGAE